MSEEANPRLKRQRMKQAVEETDPPGASASKRQRRSKEAQPTTTAKQARTTAAKSKAAKAKGKTDKEQPEQASPDATQQPKFMKEILAVLRNFVGVDECDQKAELQSQISDWQHKTCKFGNVYWTRETCGLHCLKEGKDFAHFSCPVKELPLMIKMAASFSAAMITAPWVATELKSQKCSSGELDIQVGRLH